MPRSYALPSSSVYPVDRTICSNYTARLVLALAPTDNHAAFTCIVHMHYLHPPSILLDSYSATADSPSLLAHDGEPSLPPPPPHPPSRPRPKCQLPAVGLRLVPCDANTTLSLAATPVHGWL
jgi:hypothetical protein